ncbi:MAG: hypothetical protein A2010_19280 [Nitrospirae bacterium GWD2_57_9]|nr:MAG: hypothetical protein A2010_19280 [Nitrospirae bacterium GWD2_57_9]
MSTFFHSSKNIQKTHGWDIELTCTHCGFSGQPRYEGWSPSLQTNRGGNVRVYAKIACAKCGSRLTNEAGSKLVELFQGLDIPEQNKKIISRFILWLFLVPAGLAFVLFFGMQMDWWTWGMGTVWILLVSGIALPVLVSVKNRQVAQLPSRCDCNKPHYVYLGSLDNEQCYRCFSCGRLMKVRE